MFIDTSVTNKFYEINPATEDLLPNGMRLKNGMIVLVEDSLVKGDPNRTESEYERDRVRACNRWATVSDLDLNDSRVVSFVATYSDGTKKKRTYSVSYAWFVKIESL